MKLPSDSKRIAIMGQTGTGKTVAGIWQLSLRSYTRIPWVIFDFKADELINEIPHLRHLGIEENLPRDPGVYAVHPHPDDLGGVVSFMWRIWERESIGVYVDEGYMVCGPDRPNPAFRSLLTQGRSKRIPVICLSQRPVWLDRFVFSESDFYQVFRLNDRRDRQTVNAFVPVDLEERIPDYYSWYYDVASDNVTLLRPVPEPQKILDTFDSRLSGRPIFL